MGAMDLTSLEREFAANPDSLIYRDLAAAYLEHGRHIEAMVVCKKGLKSHPGDPQGRILMAEIYLAQSKPPKARQELEKLIEEEPNYGEAFARLGFVLLQMGLREDAATRFRQALKLDAGNETAIAGLTELGIAPDEPVEEDSESYFHDSYEEEGDIQQDRTIVERMDEVVRQEQNATVVRESPRLQEERALRRSSGVKPGEAEAARIETPPPPPPETSAPRPVPQPRASRNIPRAPEPREEEAVEVTQQVRIELPPEPAKPAPPPGPEPAEEPAPESMPVRARPAPTEPAPPPVEKAEMRLPSSPVLAPADGAPRKTTKKGKPPAGAEERPLTQKRRPQMLENVAPEPTEAEVRAKQRRTLIKTVSLLFVLVSLVGGGMFYWRQRTVQITNLVYPAVDWLNANTEASLKKAVDHFDRALQLDPENETAHGGRLLAATLLWGRYRYDDYKARADQALSEAQAVASKKPVMPASFHAGLAYHGLYSRDPSAGMQRAEAAASQLRDAARVYAAIASIHAANGELDKAENTFKKGYDPELPETGYAMGEMFLRKGGFDNARKLFKQASDAARNVMNRRALEIKNRIGEGPKSEGKRKALSGIYLLPEDHYNHGLAIAQHALLLAQEGELQVSQAQELLVAWNEIPAELRSKVSEALGLFTKSLILRWEGKEDEADKLQAQAMGLDPDNANFHLFAARALLDKYEAAENKGAAKNPAWLQQAEKASALAVKALPGRGDVLRLRARLFLKMERWDDALKASEDAAKNSDTDLRKAEAWLFHARANIGKKNDAGARGDLDFALRFRTNYPEAEWEYGMILVREKKVDEALPRLQKAAESFRNFNRKKAAETYVVIGGLLKEKKKDEEAMQAYLNSVQAIEDSRAYSTQYPEPYWLAANEVKDSKDPKGKDLALELLTKYLDYAPEGSHAKDAGELMKKLQK